MSNSFFIICWFQESLFYLRLYLVCLEQMTDWETGHAVLRVMIKGELGFGYFKDIGDKQGDRPQMESLQHPSGHQTHPQLGGPQTRTCPGISSLAIGWAGLATQSTQEAPKGEAPYDGNAVLCASDFLVPARCCPWRPSISCTISEQFSLCWIGCCSVHE